MQDLSGYWEQFVFLLFLQLFPLHVTGIAEVFTGERLSEHYAYFCWDRRSVLTFFLNKQQEGCFHLHFVTNSRNNRQLKKTSIRPPSPFKIPTLSLPAALHLPSLKETHKQNSQRFRKNTGGTIVSLVRQETYQEIAENEHTMYKWLRIHSHYSGKTGRPFSNTMDPHTWKRKKITAGILIFT